MWIEATYKGTAISVRDPRSTSVAGKNLPIVSPYTAKMTLLGKSIERYGPHSAEKNLSWIKGMKYAFLPPRFFTTTAGIQRILVPQEDKGSGTQEQKAELKEKMRKGTNYTIGIATVEFNFYAGEFKLYFQTGEPFEKVEELLHMITYFGRRGSLVQCVGVSEVKEVPEAAFQEIDLATVGNRTIMPVQVMDMTETIKWKHLNIYENSKVPPSAQQMKWFGGRFRRKEHSHNHTTYEQIM